MLFNQGKVLNISKGSLSFSLSVSGLFPFSESLSHCLCSPLAVVCVPLMLFYFIYSGTIENHNVVMCQRWNLASERESCTVSIKRRKQNRFMTFIGRKLVGSS